MTENGFPEEKVGGDQTNGDGTTTTRFGAIDSEHEPESASPGLNQEQSSAVAALPAGSALLIVQRGPNSEARFLLQGERTTAGRKPACDIFLDDVTVSRKHCEFLSSGDGFDVRDVGSLNGTYVNRQRIDAAKLRAGDEVQIGKFRLTYHPSSASRQDTSEAQ